MTLSSDTEPSNLKSPSLAENSRKHLKEAVKMIEKKMHDFSSCNHTPSKIFFFLNKRM